VMPLHEIPGEPPTIAFGFIGTLIPGRKVCQAPTASRASSRRRGPFHFHTTGAEPHFRVGFPGMPNICKSYDIPVKARKKERDQTNWAICGYTTITAVNSSLPAPHNVRGGSGG
jgi:hypothetical protein